jgi:hypothetical protein
MNSFKTTGMSFFSRYPMTQNLIVLASISAVVCLGCDNRQKEELSSREAEGSAAFTEFSWSAEETSSSPEENSKCFRRANDLLSKVSKFSSSSGEFSEVSVGLAGIGHANLLLFSIKRRDRNNDESVSIGERFPCKSTGDSFEWQSMRIRGCFEGLKLKLPGPSNGHLTYKRNSCPESGTLPLTIEIDISD